MRMFFVELGYQGQTTSIQRLLQTRLQESKR